MLYKDFIEQATKIISRGGNAKLTFSSAIEHSSPPDDDKFTMKCLIVKIDERIYILSNNGNLDGGCSNIASPHKMKYGWEPEASVNLISSLISTDTFVSEDDF